MHQAYLATTVNYDHRYLNKSRLLKFCYVPTTCAASSNGLFAAATNSTNQTNKHRCLSNIDFLRACTTCLVCFIIIVNGHIKKALEDRR
jgi:hypothetical protein